MIFLQILIYNVIPIAVLLGVGILLQKLFALDIRTLSKLNFYLFSPVLIFKMIYESKMKLEVLVDTLLFFFLFMASLYVLTEIVIRIKRYNHGMRSAMRNSVLFYNSANYAIPLNQLVFAGNPFTMSIQLIIMMMQSLIPNTYGIYSVNSHKVDKKEIWKTILGMPVIYAIPLGFAMYGLDIPIPEPIQIPIDYIVNGFVVSALLTLGVQLGSMKWTFKFTDVLISAAIRLAAGPALGALIVWLLGMEGLMAQALILSCAVPTSLSSVLLAVEFDNEPEFSSQAVLASTILSMFTVTFVIYLIM
jgi:predicted permease